jgi:CHAT domain-containing protein
MPPAEHQKQVKALEEEREKLEAEIGRGNAEFRALSRPVTLEAVRAAIPANAALVEFFAYRPANAKAAKASERFGPPRYVAYVLRREGEPQWAELGEAKAIDEVIGNLRRALRKSRRADVRQLARAADEKLMRPVRALLARTRHILVSPDGALNLTPFAALVDEKGKYLIENYELSYLTSGRDLLRLQAPRESRSAPLIVANPDFGLIPGESLARRSKARPAGQTKQAEDDRKEFEKIIFRALPGAIQEASDLKKILPQATLLTGAQATETALKQAVAPRILHVATHGFFLQDAEKPLENARGLDFSNFSDLRSASWAARIENPLLKSGLALAGANEHRGGADDGLLTAMEAANLDLWGTKLVVLSACDTGVGEVRNGEGVYGLRRALVLAGAETQVMSLWPVSDKETRSLMAGYYKRLLNGEGRAEALRQAQLEMLKNPRQRHPFYWASFIQAGEWANLDGKR